jgi:hypothetical protein
MEINDDQGMLGLKLGASLLTTNFWQRVYFGNWLRDYSQVR